jgi:hypothetical protein
MRGDRDEKAWAFESAVEKALWWMLRSTLGRALRLMLPLWRGSKIFRISSYAGAGILMTAGIAFTSVRTYENRHASIHVGPGAYELSLRGDRFSIYTPKGIEVWNLDKRRRIGTVRDGDQTPDFMSPDGCSPGECSTASIRSTPWRTSGYGVRKMVRLCG